MAMRRECGFRLERDLKPPVEDWLVNQGLRVREEFQTTFGICDLVGCTLNSERVDARLALHQRTTIGPPQRVHLWHQIPDAATGLSITLEALAAEYSGVFATHYLAGQVGRLEKAGFVRTQADGSIQKLNGWHPLQDRLVAIELKLNRLESALEQATRYLSFAQESYIAAPLENASRWAIGCPRERLDRLGIGLLGVEPHAVSVLVDSKLVRNDMLQEHARTHAVERFWRTKATSN